MIEELSWDSDFFGYKVGKIHTSDKTFNYAKFIKTLDTYKLVYIFSKEKLEFRGLKLVDEKVTFSKQLNSLSDKSQLSNKIEIFNPEKHNFESLRELALISGVYSRFNIDKGFKDNEFGRLYEEWITKTVFKDQMSNTLVLEEDNEILGFITIDNKTRSIANIGLIAVNENARGKGVATKLIINALVTASVSGSKTLKVVTQAHNEPAIKLYKKSGFEIEDVTYIYHYWNL